MKANTKQLLLHLGMLKKLAPTNPSLPVLRHVSFTGSHMMATDLEVSMEIPFKTGFTASVDVHILYKVVSSLKRHDVVDIALIKGKLVVAAASMRFNVIAEEINHDLAMNMGQKQELAFSTVFTNDLLSAASFVGNDELRPVMTTVYMGTEIVGTDAHVLYRSRNLTSEIEDYSMMVPKSVMKFIPRNLAIDIIRSVDIPLKGMTVLPGNIELKWRCLDGRYPNYEAVCPKVFTRTFTTDLAELRELVNAALITSNAVTNRGRFVFTSQTLTVSCDNDMNENGFEGDVKCGACADGIQDRFEIGLNLKKLKHVLGHVGNDTATFMMNEANNAVVINDMVLIMPVMLNDY